MNRRQVLIGGGVAGLAAATALSFSRTGSMTDYGAAVAAQRKALADNPGLADLVRYATLAANSHNTQSWRLHLDQRRISILPDFTRHTPAVDPDNHHLFVSLGCAAENFALAAAASGRRGEPRFDPEGIGAVHFDFGAASAERSLLFEAIPKRQSTRSDYDGHSVAASDLAILAAGAQVPGVDLVLLTDRPQIEQLLDLVIAGNRAQMADPVFMRELKHWIRFNPRQAFEARDGLFSAATGNPTAPAGLAAWCSIWPSGSRRRTSDTPGKSAPRRVSQSSCRSAPTRRIGCRPGAPASVSRCRRRRLASNMPL
jgi:hypothetical protein